MGVPQYTLNDGTTIPAIGLGTWPLKGQEAVTAIASALDTGYRLIDSAFNYENEGAVGAAVRASRVPRDEIVVTSKLPGRHHAHDAAVRAIEESVLRTGLDHLDLYLIHWPNPSQHLFLEAWQAMIEARERGLLRSIGTSNFLPAHIDALVAATGVAPAVNQVELHPLFPQSAQHAYDEAHGVRDEAWSPFGRGSDFLSDPTLAAVAAAHGRTPAQVILRWDVQRGVVPLPKSADPARQAQNLAVFDFELTDDEVATVTALGRPDGRLWGQDPAVYEEF